MPPSGRPPCGPPAMIADPSPPLTLYRTRPHDFRAVVRNVMRQDWNWTRSAVKYEELYRRVRE